MKTVELKNTEIKNIILSNEKAERIIYTSTNNSEFLQFFEKGIYDHYEISFDFNESVVHQFASESFLVISTSEDNDVNISYLMNNSILHFPN